MRTVSLDITEGLIAEKTIEFGDNCNSTPAGKVLQVRSATCYYINETTFRTIDAT